MGKKEEEEVGGNVTKQIKGKDTSTEKSEEKHPQALAFKNDKEEPKTFASEGNKKDSKTATKILKEKEHKVEEFKTVAPQIKEKENKTSSTKSKGKKTPSIGIEKIEDKCTTIPCEEKEDIEEPKKETTSKLQSIESKPTVSPQQPKEISAAKEASDTLETHIISTSEVQSLGVIESQWENKQKGVECAHK